MAALTLLSCGSGSTDDPPISCCDSTTFVIRRSGGPPVDYGSWDLEIRAGGENVRCAHTRGVWLCETGSYVGIDAGDKQGMPIESRIRIGSGSVGPSGRTVVVRRSGKVLFDGPFAETASIPLPYMCFPLRELTLEATVEQGAQ